MTSSDLDKYARILLEETELLDDNKRLPKWKLNKFNKLQNNIEMALRLVETLEKEKQAVAKEMRSARRGGADVAWDYEQQHDLLIKIQEDAKIG